MGCDDAMTKSETKKIKIAQVIGDATTGGVISCGAPDSEVIGQCNTLGKALAQ